MKLEDHERRKFAVYCRMMADAEEQAFEGKQKLFEMQKIDEKLTAEMTKRDKSLIAAYTIVAMELEKWDEAETIRSSDVGMLPPEQE